MNSFLLSIPSGMPRRLAIGWLFLALYSLVGAGLVVVLILIARTPFILNLLPWTGSFRTALVIHVDLSVLVWFLSIAGFLACLNLREQKGWFGFGTLLLATIGAVLITFSPFLGVDAPFMNNYVPVLGNNAFFLGLGLFLTGVGGMAGFGILNSRVASTGERALLWGLKTGLFILLLSLASWLWSYLTMPANVDGLLYYEALFWGGGHILQFTHTQLLVVVWLWLATAAGGHISLTPRVAVLLFTLGAAPALLGGVFLHLNYIPGDVEFQVGFANLMKYGGGVAALPVGLALLPTLLTRPSSGEQEPTPLRLTLFLSLLLFGIGGVIGFLIKGINVTIPSHYHGSIVSVTVAYMGLIFYLLPRLGFQAPNRRWAVWQLWLYGGGSLLHVFGLAWSGVLGIQRKTAGEAQGLETMVKKMAMGLTGLGGLIAVIGGILFLIICYRAVRSTKSGGGAALLDALRAK
ncbi:MAG: cbb3-type cytochrome c oxidase subunit I [Magnetococcus sp. DMHC-6]